jgi:hypothetical protein
VTLPADFPARAVGPLLGQTLPSRSGITEGYFVAHPTRPDENVAPRRGQRGATHARSPLTAPAPPHPSNITGAEPRDPSRLRLWASCLQPGLRAWLRLPRIFTIGSQVGRQHTCGGWSESIPWKLVAER